MQNQAVELNSVIYNAANQRFEALTTVYAGLSSAHPLSFPSPMVRAGRTQPRKVVDAFEMLRQLAA